MYRNILIPVALDHEQAVADKIAVARRMASEGGRITLLTVIEPVPAYVTEYVNMKPEGRIRSDVAARLRALSDGGDDLTCEVVLGKPGVAIATYAADNDVDLIVVGSHRPGLQDYFLGSTAARVVRRAPCAVFVLR